MTNEILCAFAMIAAAFVGYALYLAHKIKAAQSRETAETKVLEAAEAITRVRVYRAIIVKRPQHIRGSYVILTPVRKGRCSAGDIWFSFRSDP